MNKTTIDIDISKEIARSLDSFGETVRDALAKAYKETGMPIRERKICHMRKRFLSRVPWEICAKYLADKGYCLRIQADQNAAGDKHIAVMFPNIEYAKDEMFYSQDRWEKSYQEDNRFDLKDKNYDLRERRTSEEVTLERNLKALRADRPKPGRPKGSRNKSLLIREALISAAPSLLEACIYIKEHETLSKESSLLINHALKCAQPRSPNA